jgi:hypothetical protein
MVFDILTFGGECQTKCDEALAGLGYSYTKTKFFGGAKTALQNAVDQIVLSEVKIVLCSVSVSTLGEFELLDKVGPSPVPFFLYCSDAEVHSDKITAECKTHASEMGAAFLIEPISDDEFRKKISDILNGISA